MKPTDTDSSEDDLEKFKESVDQQFLQDDLYLSNPAKRAKILAPNGQTLLPSLRRNIQEEDEALNFFRVTPEFQKYIAKHLSAKLEEELVQQEAITSTHKTIQHQMRTVNCGIKLLWSSLHNIIVPKLSVEDVKAHNYNITKKRANFDEDLLEEECKQMAVNGADIINQKDVKFWSNRTKAPVFYYKLKKGVLELQE